MNVSEFTGNGKRRTNEDSKLVMPAQGIFMVCDGVGGQANGEVASRICCESIRDYFSGTNPVVDIGNVKNAIAITEKNFDACNALPEYTGTMATTLAFLYINNSNALSVHAGDSRIYHIRGYRVAFVTNDHTIPNELLAAGIISKEEATNHPSKNQITNAVSGSSNPARADFKQHENILPGDYFLLCSDGVTESLDDEQLAEIISVSENPDKAAQVLKDICEKNSKDNFTGVLIRI